MIEAEFRKKFADLYQFIEDNNLPLDIYMRKSEGEQKIMSAHITSPTLGGILAGWYGDGWVPCWPEEPNYPTKGRWYSPVLYCYKETWQHVLKVALMPKEYFYLYDSGMGRQTAIARAAKLRSPLRAAVMVALIETLEKNKNKRLMPNVHL